MYSFPGVYRSGVFFERFWREFRISVKSHKPVRKTYTPENGLFSVLMTFSFLFSSNVHLQGAELPFLRRKSALKCAFKETGPRKRRAISLVWELLAPDYGLLDTFDGIYDYRRFVAEISIW